ncbi:MAG: NlpC/P60 family protein [candidate division KSB1 bacterium]|nr:NlpC/P60 family protein [candidate division KSB1 bacterium]
MTLCWLGLLFFHCAPYYGGRQSNDAARQQVYAESLSRWEQIAAATQDQRLYPLLSAIRSYLGTPYQAAGMSRQGLDCSGLVALVFRESYGFQLPHNAHQIYSLSQKIFQPELAMGDLVFFSYRNDRQMTHVGIYLRDDFFAHASERYGVIISDLKASSYRSSFRGAGRILNRNR